MAKAEASPEHEREEYACVEKRGELKGAVMRTLRVQSVVASHWLSHGGFSLAGSVARRGENFPSSRWSSKVSFLWKNIRVNFLLGGGKVCESSSSGPPTLC